MDIRSGGTTSLMKHGSVKTPIGGRPQSNRRNFLFCNCCYFGRRDGLRFLPNFAPEGWSSFDRARKKEDVRLSCSRSFSRQSRHPARSYVDFQIPRIHMVKKHSHQHKVSDSKIIRLKFCWLPFLR